MLFVFALNTRSHARVFESNVCVRIYCKQDVGTKIRNDNHHGRFFSAYRYEVSSGSVFTSGMAYRIDRKDFLEALDYCSKTYQMNVHPYLPWFSGKALAGTNAGGLESI